MSLTKVNLPLPFGHRKRKFNLNHNIVATQEFGGLQPLLLREMVDGDSFRARCSSFARCAPLVVPTFADVSTETFAFFVPFRILWKDAEKFFTTTTYVDSNGTTRQSAVPRWRNNGIVAALRNDKFSTIIANPDDTAWDFSLPAQPPSTAKIYYRLTTLGKRVVNILLGLGYRLNYTLDDNTAMSLAPLLSYIKVYHEYFVPGLLYPVADMEQLFEMDSYYVNTHTDNYIDTIYSKILTAVGVYTYLAQDYFTAAWTGSTGFGNNQQTYLRYQVGNTSGNNNGNEQVESNGNLYPTYGKTLSGSAAPITQIGLNALRSLTSLVMRNSIAGNKYVNRFLARFGHAPNAGVLQRPVFLGSASQPLQVSDVMTQATTEQAQTGDYAGKATTFGKGQFSYEAQEPGYFLVLSVVQPRTSFVQGRKREVFHTDAYEFYTPEFDTIGTQPIRHDEIFSEFSDDDGYKAAQGHGGTPNSVFGFSPRYAEYKCGFDNLLGDFAIRSRNTGLDAFHLFRYIEPDTWAQDSNFRLSLSDFFLSANPTTKFNHFGRIFSDTTLYRDSFIFTHNINIDAIRPMHDIGETFDVEDVHGVGDSVRVDRNGSYIS